MVECRVLSMDGNHENSVCIVDLSTGATVEWTRAGLKALIKSGDVICLNYKISKSGKLIKTKEAAQAVDTKKEAKSKDCNCKEPCKECKCKHMKVVIDSYDVTNGICSLHLSANKECIEKFLVLVGSDVVVGNDSKKTDDNRTFVQFLHIDSVVWALGQIPEHVVSKKALQKYRTHENFSYMTDEQYSCLCDYLNSTLNIK